MEKVHIQKTKSSPEVIMDFDAGTLEIKGESYPENAVAFYKPVFDWIAEATNAKKAIKIEFKLDYFNTSSSKCVMDLLDLSEKYFSGNGKIEVKWYYKEDDDDMLETGQEFAGDLKLPFEILSYS